MISNFEKFNAQQYDNFDDTMNAFVDRVGIRPSLAVLAVAGPVHNGEVKFSNRQWQLNAYDLEKRCGIDHIHLMNDFAAMAYSVLSISNDSFINLKSGQPLDNSPLLVAGPGTGFGSCLLIPNDSNWQALPCEGGHSLFAPQTRLDRSVHDIFSRRYHAVSIEHICGGRYLPELVDALSEIHGVSKPNLSPQQIIERGESGDTLCKDICQIRANAIISGLANMALVTGARGGIVVAGGVAGHLSNFLADKEAIEQVANIWPQGDFLQNIPIRLLVDPLAPLVGAAAHYLQQKQ